MKKRILIVDDDIAIRKGLKKLLKKANYDVAVAADGFEAVDRFTSEPIDLLLLDLNMPGKDGWAAYEGITRKDPYVPTIIMTGLPDQFPIAAAGGTGTLLEKPLEPKELLSVIESLLDEPRSNHWLRRRHWLQDARSVPSTRYSLKNLFVDTRTQGNCPTSLYAQWPASFSVALIRWSIRCWRSSLPKVAMKRIATKRERRGAGDDTLFATYETAVSVNQT